jgi:hypothetical protein
MQGTAHSRHKQCRSCCVRPPGCSCRRYTANEYGPCCHMIVYVDSSTHRRTAFLHACVSFSAGRRCTRYRSSSTVLTVLLLV